MVARLWRGITGIGPNSDHRDADVSLDSPVTSTDTRGCSTRSRGVLDPAWQIEFGEKLGRAVRASQVMRLD
jgi:hypothetical protein